jgi:hypothetical protein
MFRENHRRALERKINSKTIDIITPGERQCKPDVVDYEPGCWDGSWRSRRLHRDKVP